MYILYIYIYILRHLFLNEFLSNLRRLNKITKSVKGMNLKKNK